MIVIRKYWFSRLSKLPASVFYVGGVYLSPGPDDVCNGSDLTLSTASTSPQGDTICEEMRNNFEQGDDLRDAELYSGTPRVFASVLPDCGSAVVVIITAGLHQSSITSSQSDSCDAGVADSCSLGALRIGLRKPSINSPDPLCSTSYRSVSGNAT